MQNLGIWKAYPTVNNEASVRDSTEISFLVNGCDVSSVMASRYVAVLPFAYFPSLQAVAVEFPLDVSRKITLTRFSFLVIGFECMKPIIQDSFVVKPTRFAEGLLLFCSFFFFFVK